MIEIADLPELMHTADEAMQNLQAAREQWLTLQAKLFALPPDPVDIAACEAQAKVIKQAKADYDYHAGYVLASLRSAHLTHHFDKRASDLMREFRPIDVREPLRNCWVINLCLTTADGQLNAKSTHLAIRDPSTSFARDSDYA